MGNSKKEDRFLNYEKSENQKKSLEQLGNIGKRTKHDRIKGMDIKLNHCPWRATPRIKPLLATTNPLQVLDLPLFTAGPCK